MMWECAECGEMLELTDDGHLCEDTGTVAARPAGRRSESGFFAEWLAAGFDGRRPSADDPRSVYVDAPSVDELFEAPFLSQDVLARAG